MAQTDPVPDGDKYKQTLSELEAGVRVPRDEQVETAEIDDETTPDPRGPQPDRDWFAAGG
jgi:hypothetical protein